MRKISKTETINVREARERPSYRTVVSSETSKWHMYVVKVIALYTEGRHAYSCFQYTPLLGLNFARNSRSIADPEWHASIKERLH